MIDSSSYEDDLNMLLDKLSKTISTFNTLSREQAEIAILDTTSKIKEGESILLKLEEELENNSNNYTTEELLEEKKKLKNYKIEYNNIVNKFKLIQDNYINKKTKNALIDEEPKFKKDLLSNEENKNNIEGKSKDNLKKNNNIELKNEQNIFENNIGNLSGVNNGSNLPEDTFDNFKNNKYKRKKKWLILGLFITFILIITFVVVIGVESNRK